MESENEKINHTIISRISMKQILEYECHSHWLVSLISFNWGQELLAWFIARKVARKYKRYLQSLERSKHLRGRYSLPLTNQKIRDMAKVIVEAQKVTVNVDGKLVYWNMLEEEWFDWLEEELVGNDI